MASLQLYIVLKEVQVSFSLHQAGGSGQQEFTLLETIKLHHHTVPSEASFDFSSVVAGWYVTFSFCLRVNLW